MVLKELVTEEQARSDFGKLRQRKDEFGLCEINIAKAIEVTGGAVSFWKRRGNRRGRRYDSHVRLYGCTVDAVAALIASIAKVVPKAIQGVGPPAGGRV